MLGFPAVVVALTGKRGCWFSPVDRLRDVRSRGDSCAMAPMLSEMPIAAAMAPLEMLRSFECTQLNLHSPLYLDLRPCRVARRYQRAHYLFRVHSGKVTRSRRYSTRISSPARISWLEPRELLCKSAAIPNSSWELSPLLVIYVLRHRNRSRPKCPALQTPARRFGSYALHLMV